MGKMRNTLKNIVVKPEGKRHLKEMDHRDGVDRFSFSQQRP
jgi:hypothetical protein